jgi:hypothetical protein
MIYKIKLAFGLLLLAQFANCFISNDFIHNPLDNVLDFTENLLVEPLVFEKEGVDKNGNRFHEKDVILQGKSNLNPDNKFQSYYKNLNVVGDNSAASDSENFEYFEGVSKPGQHINIQLVPKQLTAEDYFETVEEPSFVNPIKLVGLHYNLDKARDSSEKMNERILNLKTQMSREDDLLNEMHNVLSENQPLSPVEDLVNSFMTYDPDQETTAAASGSLPTFKEKLSENVELAKKSGFTNFEMGHRMNPNIFNDLLDNSDESTEKSAEDKHIDYFEPVFVDDVASNEEKKAKEERAMKMHLNLEDNLMHEMKNVLDYHAGVFNPVEDMITSFMTHKSDVKQGMPRLIKENLKLSGAPNDLIESFERIYKPLLNTMPKFYEAHQKELDRVLHRFLKRKGFMADGTRMPAHTTPISTQVKLSSTENRLDSKHTSVTVKPEFDTHDYFEPFVTNGGRKYINNESTKEFQLENPNWKIPTI